MSEQRDPETFDLRRWWRVVVGWGLIALGALFILLGWFGVSGDPHVARQLSYLASGGIGGLATVIVGVGLLVSEDMRSERRRLGRIEARLLDVAEAVRAQGEALAAREESRATRGSGLPRRSR